MNVLERMFESVLSQLPRYQEAGGVMPAEYPKDDSQFDLTELDRNGRIYRPYYRENIYVDDPESSENGIDKEEIGASEGAIREGGIEALAFYKSYRFVNERPFPGEWGIFFINKGIQHLTHLIELDFPNRPGPRKLAFDFIAAHELFHARVDIGVLGFESAAKKHFYLPQKRAFSRCPTQEPEEALANRSAWKFLNRDPRTNNDDDIKSFFELFMDRQPNAYSRFKEPQTDLQAEVAAGIFSGLRYKGAADYVLGKWIGHLPPYVFFSDLIPRHLVVGFRYSKFISPSRSFPAITLVQEAPRLLDKYPSHRKKWADAKAKLIDAPERVGLDFKRWPPNPPLWSMRVDKGFRAHLRPISIAEGVWEAVKYGSHDELGH